MRVSQILNEVEDYSEINKNDIPKNFNAESFEKRLTDEEIETKINKHLIRLGYVYKNYKWIK
jgi:hypothetical protein